jgi:hypothetical protein
MVSLAKDGSRYFSRIDLQSEYDHIRIRRILVEDNIPEKRFIVQEKRFIVQAASDVVWTENYTQHVHFIKLMTRVLGSFIGKFVLVYLDGILVCSKTRGKHNPFMEVFGGIERGAAANQCEVVHLGFVLSKDGLNIDPEKIKAILKWACTP